jgi:hypothetical protein
MSPLEFSSEDCGLWCCYKLKLRHYSTTSPFNNYCIQLSEEETSISIEWILYTGLLPVLAWREGNIARSAKSILYIYIYCIAAGLGNKKISFPFSPQHPSYIKRWLSTKGASAISPMQWRTWTYPVIKLSRVLKLMGRDCNHRIQYQYIFKWCYLACGGYCA